MVVKSKKIVEYTSEGIFYNFKKQKKFSYKLKKIVEYNSERLFCIYKKSKKVTNKG